jgi:hypothetical protein
VRFAVCPRKEEIKMATMNRDNSAANIRNESKRNTPQPLLSSSKSRSTDNNDDIIGSLAEQYENRRARQVGEWERLYGQNVYRGA